MLREKGDVVPSIEVSNPAGKGIMLLKSMSKSMFSSLSRMSLSLAVAASFGGITASAASARIAYTVTSLSAATNGTNVTATALNNSGQVTGYFQTDVTVNFPPSQFNPTGSTSTYNATLAFLYSKGTLRSLGSLGSPTNQYSKGFDINNAGVVTGETYIQGVINPSPYTLVASGNGGLSAPTIPLFPRGSARYSRGYGINDSGLITGIASSPYSSIGYVSPNAYYDINGITQGNGFGSLGSGSTSGNSINNAGLVTGYSGVPGGNSHAFVFDSTGFPNFPQDLGTLPGYLNSGGNKINDQGQIVGSSYNVVNGGITGRAFLYENRQMRDLGTLGGTYSSAYSINNKGIAVGRSKDATNADRAFVFDGTSIVDLNSLIDPTLGISLAGAQDINDNGQIVANGGGGAYLLTPVPEPSSILGLFPFGLMGAVAARKRKLSGNLR